MFRISQYMRELAQAQATGVYPTVKDRKARGPVVIWNLIRRCNLTCKHCYALSADHDYEGELLLPEVFTVMDDLKAFGVPALILSGGEPLLRPDIFEISALLDAGDIAGLLAEAVRARRNILVSGGTSTGKTTFLNALIREIPAEERLILIEDTPELHMRHANAVGLLAARSELGEARVTAEDLLAASLRMRPDRIVVGELRGPEAFTFLRAVNTGHPGSMTTVHADSAARAIEQITLLVLQAGTGLNRQDIHHYVRSTVDVYVHLDRSGGRRQVAELLLGQQVRG